MAEIKKINIVSCDVRADKGSYKTYSIKDSDGKIYGSTDSFDIGENEVEIVINGNYTNIKKIKPQQEKKFNAKDWNFEKKKLALEMAMDVVKLTPRPALSTSQATDLLLETSTSILNWINKP